jgi:hypothetical protein
MYGSPRRCAHRTQGCTLTYTLTHTYIPNPNQVGIDSTWPRGGPTDGGTRVTINGHGFTSLATAFGVRCRFNEVVVQAMPEEVTPTHTVCLLPPRDEDGAVTVTVSLTLALALALALTLAPTAALALTPTLTR